MMIINVNFKQRLALGLSALMAFLVSVTLFYGLWQWREDWLLINQKPSLSLPETREATNTMVAAIPNEHVFGKAFEKGEVPITNLQLRVTGIVKVNNGQNAFSKAYISIAGQPSKIYQVGDTLPYGVKIYDIVADAVILENDSRLEKLLLLREKLEFKPREERME